MSATNRQAGQATLLTLGVLRAVLAGVLVLFAFGQALGAGLTRSGAPNSPPSRPRR